MWERQAGLCALCHRPMAPSFTDVHVDHRMALANGGKHESANLQLTHATCNLKKGAKLPGTHAGG